MGSSSQGQVIDSTWKIIAEETSDFFGFWVHQVEEKLGTAEQIDIDQIQKRWNLSMEFPLQM